MEIRENGVRYIHQNNEVFVVGVDDYYSTNLTIPSSINGNPVVKICEYAFTHTNIVAISIPNSINYIDRGAFFGCGNLSKFKVWYDKNNPNRDLTISDLTFSGCINLKDFSAEKSLVKVQTFTFEDCFGLKELKTLVKELHSYGFKNCESLSCLTFADNAKIRDLALENMPVLSRLTFKGNAQVSKPILLDVLQNEIRIFCSKSSNLVDLAYEGYNVEII